VPDDDIVKSLRALRFHAQTRGARRGQAIHPRRGARRFARHLLEQRPITWNRCAVPLIGHKLL
jgi:hypothetical protein